MSYRDAPAEDIAALARRLRTAKSRLRQTDERDVRALVKAIREVPHRHVEQLERQTRLSVPMIRWAIDTSLERFTVERVVAMCVRGMDAHPGAARGRPFQSRADQLERSPGARVNVADVRTSLCVVVLSGNVFTACLRAVLTPLVFGVPVLVKASSRDDVLARALVEALPAPYREAAAVLSHPGGDARRDDALLRHADVVHAYGTDHTLRALRARTPIHARFIPHGHGVGLAYFPRPLDNDAEAYANALALDIAAYEQRGCLSPHIVYVQPGDERRLGQLLHAALADLERSLPTGGRTSEENAARRMWLETVAALGEVLEGPHHAVAVEDDVPLPNGPGQRSVVVRSSSSGRTTGKRSRAADFAETVAALGSQLKSIGVALPEPEIGTLAWDLPSGVAPRLVPLGRMQILPFDALADGYPPWEGLLWRGSSD